MASMFSPTCFGIKFSDPNTLRTLYSTIHFPKWRISIDCKHWVSFQFGTLTCINWLTTWRSYHTHGSSCLSPLMQLTQSFSRKSRCCVCENRQFPRLDIDWYTSNAPVASHESFYILLPIAATHDLIFEGRDTSTAYLYREGIIQLLQNNQQNFVVVKSFLVWFVDW